MIGKKFKKYEIVIPAYGVYDVLIREAGDAIKKHGPALIDPRAELEFMMSRSDAAKLKEHLDVLLGTDTNQLAFYVRDAEEEQEE